MPRTAQAVIDQAIAENRVGERLLYGFAVSLVLLGIVEIVWAITNSNTTLSVVGTVTGTLTSGLFLPAIRLAMRTRRESVAIRLLEAPLSRADTAKDASEMLQKLFEEMYSDKQQDGLAKPRKV